MSSKNLMEELLNVEAPFYGIYRIVAEEIGMDIEPQPHQRNKEMKKTEQQFAMEWCRTYMDDIEIATDNRMMVPVFMIKSVKRLKYGVVGAMRLNHCPSHLNKSQNLL